ncbi:hypothetical protein OIU74_017223 [Salix koriyanagi]|uniref:Uncharacterized protein n=1 Tax=Salix koriyanagi TaxID=2511006 RepID=A0A9Q0STM8_9ROSI|nr:hypothetical protein OIU74_017223 [Salix koriyanagi]
MVWNKQVPANSHRPSSFFSTPATDYSRMVFVLDSRVSSHLHILILLTSYNSTLQQYYRSLFLASLLLLFAISGLFNTKWPL